MQEVFVINNNKWRPVIIDYLYLIEDSKTLKCKDVFAHAKIISKSESREDDYYELMIPSHNYFICYIDEKKIKAFL
jgi:hypothetical protein